MNKIYKNWKAICKITDDHVMWAIALLELDSDLGRTFVERFPEYFTREVQAGPYPLSLLRKEGQIEESKAYAGGDRAYDDYLVMHGICDRYNIPVKSFQPPEMDNSGGEGIEPLPAELLTLRGIGHIFVWAGHKWIVVQDGWPDCTCFAAPDYLIDVTR